MEYSYEIDEVPQRELPSIKHDVEQAKMFLMKHSTESGDSLYNHLAELLEKILSERPNNAVDVFEEYSKKLKDQRYKEKSNNYHDYFIPIDDYNEAEKLIQLFRIIKEEGKNDMTTEDNNLPENNNKILQNLFNTFYYFEQAGVALPRSDLVYLDLSIKKLLKEKPITKARFWGKILGRPKNFYVLEAEFSKEELLRRLEIETRAAAGEEKKGDEDVNEDEENENDDVDDDDEEEEEEEEEEKGEGKEAIEDSKANENDKKMSAELFVDVRDNKFDGIEKDLNNSISSSYQKIPPEQIGTGANKKVYYVCNLPGLDEWIELPAVMPLQIIIAKNIVHYFTGSTETLIHSYPLFPGNEGNYLRAQIARISASTLVSPLGFFTFGDDENPELLEQEENEEEEEQQQQQQQEQEGILDETEIEIEDGEIDVGGTISVNNHYKPLPVKELVDSSMSNWCHHSEYILSQGRTIWWNPHQETLPEDQLVAEDEENAEDEEVQDEEEEVEEEEEEEEKAIGVRREIGPPLLTPLSEDTTTDGMPSWTARLSSNIQPDNSFAIVRSNIWPGAYAFANDKIFANVYIGSGHKYNVRNFSPLPVPPIQEQYKIGSEIMEIQDPSVEAEEAYRLAHPLPPPSSSAITKTPDFGSEFGESLEDQSEELDNERDDLTDKSDEKNN